MKNNIKKIAQISLWTLLSLFFFGFYFIKPNFSSLEQDQSHLKEMMPVNAEFVILINPIELVKDYMILLSEQPDALRELEAEMDEDGPNIDFGINPFKKIAIVQFYDESNDVRGLATMAEVYDFNAFVNGLNPRDNKPAAIDYNGGSMVILEKDNQVFIKDKNVGICVEIKNTNLTETIAQQCFDNFFRIEENLYDSEPTFAEAVKSEDQLTFWSSHVKNIAEDFNPQLGVLSAIFDRKNLAVNVTPKGFELDAKFELTNQEAILPREVMDLELQGSECFRFGASVNPELFANYFDMIVPEDKKFLLGGWNGGISAAINGFRNVNIKHIVPKLDSAGVLPNTGANLYPFDYDTVDLVKVKIPFMPGGINENFSYPYFTFACELNNVTSVKSFAENDPTITKVGEYFSFELKDYVLEKVEKEFLVVTRSIIQPQRVYFYFVDNSIVFCPEVPEEDFVPQYSTFGMVFQFDPFIENYEEKGLFDGPIVQSLKNYGFNGYRVRFKEIKDGYVHFEGIFDLKNTPNHLVGFPLLFKKLQDFSLLDNLGFML